MDDSGLGWKLFAGYNFNQYFGAEFAYVDLDEVKAGGKADIKGSIRDVNFSAEVSGELSGEINGFTFAGVGRYPVTDQLDIFAKAGGFYWDIDLKAKLSGSGDLGSVPFDRSISPSLSDSGISYVFGLGAEYDITENLSLRAEWERYGYDYDKNNIRTDGDVDFFSAGVVYAF